MRKTILSLLLFPLLSGAGQGADVKTEAEALFAHKIWPLISAKCLACHGDEKQKGELDLRTRDVALVGGENGAAIKPGDAAGSLFYQAVTWEDEDLQMPPKENDRLTRTEVYLIREWINAGAPWPGPDRVRELVNSTEDQWSVAGGVRMKTSGGLSEEWTRRNYQLEDLWAYQPLKKPDDHFFIDGFVNNKLRELGLQPAPSADRRTLIRRATYDLTGLPPTPEEVAAFVNDPAEEGLAFAKVVNRLLDSPHYGEQWAQHWLDVVRYADSSGFANDYERGNSWRYRDYVIRSFNSDKRYDRFIREQIAGDEIDPDNPEMIVATGFLRMGPWELTGMEVAAIARQRFLDDAVNSIGETFLGHILRCAKCHDHKFDPVPTRDYYSLYAVFQTTQVAERQAPFTAEENVSGFAEKEYITRRRDRALKQAAALSAKTRAAERKWFKERNLPYQSRSEAFKKQAPPEHIPPRQLGFTSEDFGLERVARKSSERTRWELERYEPVALSGYAGATPELKAFYRPTRPPNDPSVGKVEAGHILVGGDAFSQGPLVKPGALSAINALVPELASVEIPDTVSGRRRALADWVAHPRNPLTLRSIVNRVWQWHFGQPIAGNPNNFGGTGKKPTHPELLDWLALTFRECGWSLKQLHRLIMMSDAYRRAATHPDPMSLAERDPNGISYAAFQPRRLTAAELRDSMLAVSGELNRTLGGIPNRPEMNLEQALQPRQVMGSFAPAWQPNPLPEQRHRRSLYALKLRGLRDPFMDVFNDPNPDFSCEARDASTVTPQVFSLFNSQISLDRAVAFAARLKQETKSISDAIDRAFRLAYSRPASREEHAACLDHFARMKQRHRSIKVERPEYPTEVIRDAVEENTGERFSFKERLDWLEDFVPDQKMADVDVPTRALAEICLVLFNANEFVYVY